MVGISNGGRYELRMWWDALSLYEVRRDVVQPPELPERKR
jgi:hypothetical protein